MSTRDEAVRSNYHTLQVLKSADPKLRKAILANCKSELLKTLSECSLNLLRGNVKLTVPEEEIPAAASHDIAKIEAAISPETSGLDYVKERLVTPRQAFDVDTLLHVHQKSVHAAQESHLLRLNITLFNTQNVTETRLGTLY